MARRYTERKEYANSFAIFFPKRICPIFYIGHKTVYRNVHLYYPAYYTPIGYYAASIPDLRYTATRSIMQFTKAQEYIGEQTPYEEADIYTKTRACAAYSGDIRSGRDMQIHLRYAFRNVDVRYVISCTSPYIETYPYAILRTALR